MQRRKVPIPPERIISDHETVVNLEEVIIDNIKLVNKVPLNLIQKQNWLDELLEK